MKSQVVLVGGFDKTLALAKSLLKKGYRVKAINNNRQDCLLLADVEKLDVTYGDGTRPYVLEEAGVRDADIVIALTKRDDDNLVICQLSKKKFLVKKTVALITDPRKTEFFHRMGIDSVVCAINALTAVIEQQALLDEMETLLPVGNGQVVITRVPIYHDAPSVGLKLKEIDLPRQVVVGCIIRGEKTVVPRGDTRILDGDVLVLLSSDQRESAAVGKLTGRWSD